jgi:hypothetical protein
MIPSLVDTIPIPKEVVVATVVVVVVAMAAEEEQGRTEGMEVVVALANLATATT